MNTSATEQSGMRTRIFFVVMASAVIVTVFAGFAPSFYLRGSFTQDRPMSFQLHVHGIVFSAWVTVFFVQTLLIARGSRRLHKRLGWIAVAIAATMVTLVAAATIEQLRRVGAPMFRVILHPTIRLSSEWRSRFTPANQKSARKLPEKREGRRLARRRLSAPLEGEDSG
jgi:hypothetical protein